LFTVKQAFFSALIALAVGFPAAFFLARREFFGRRFLSSLSSIPLAFPALLLAIGFVSVFGMNGSITGLFPFLKNKSLLYSFYGIITVQGFYNFPLIMKSCADAWEKIRPEEKNAAVMLGARPVRVFATVTLIQLLPALLSSFALVFLFCYFSFIIVLLFGAAGTSTLEVEIYHAARSSVNIRGASGLAVTETVIALLAAACLGLIRRKSDRSSGHSLTQSARRSPLGGAAEICSCAVLMLFIAVFLLAPLGAIVLNGIVPGALAGLFKTRGFIRALGTTVITSSSSACLALAAACAYSCFLRLGAGTRENPRTNFRVSARNVRGQTISRANDSRGDSRAHSRGRAVFSREDFFSALALVPLSVSSVVMGLGIMLLIRRGNAFVYIIARSALLWTFAFRQIYPAFSRVSSDVIGAAKMLSSRTLDTVFGVLLPETRRACLSAWAFCFAACASDASLPLMLALPRFDTLALYTYRLAGSYRLPQACAAGLILIALTGIVFVLADCAASFPAKTAHTAKDRQ
jgi:thiamine transport system permease protein